MVVYPLAPVDNPGPSYGAMSGFTGESPVFGGLSGRSEEWARPMNPGWEGPVFAPFDGPGWMTVHEVFALVENPPSTTMDGSGAPPSASSPAPTGVFPPHDPESGMDPSGPGGPMASYGSYGNGPNSGVQPLVSVPGTGASTFVFKIDYNNDDPAPSFNDAPPPSPSSLTPERGRPELNEPTSSQSATVGVLVTNNPTGPQMTPAPGTAPANVGLGAPISSVGNVPLQANSLLDASNLNADRSTSSSSAAEGMIGVANSQSGRASRPRGPSTNPVPVDHAALRPTLGPDDRASDGPRESLPLPQGADLIVEGLPMGRDSLEAALDRFVRQLDELDAGLLDVRGPAPIVIFSLSLLSAAASAEMARRYVRRKTSLKRGMLAVDPAGRQLTLGFPELPGSWSERRA